MQWFEYTASLAALWGLWLEVRGNKLAIDLLPWSLSNPALLMFNLAEGNPGQAGMFLAFTLVTWWELVRRMRFERRRLR